MASRNTPIAIQRPATAAISNGATDERSKVRCAHHDAVPSGGLRFGMAATLGQEEDEQRDKGVEAEAL
jgi:hypothetical protein